MDNHGTIEVGISEDVLLHEDGAPDAANDLEQSSPTAQDIVRRKRKNLAGRPNRLQAFSILALLSFMVLAMYLLQNRYSLYAVSGPSMEPTLSSGQSIIIEKTKEPIRNSIILFSRPEGWTYSEKENSLIIKRLYGIPGDTLAYKNKVFSINDKIIYTLPEGYDCKRNDYHHVLTENQYFVMGDNALNSLDSRKIFCSTSTDVFYVDSSKIIGYGNVVAKF